MSRTTLKFLVVLSGLLNAYSTPVLDVRQAEPDIPSPWVSTGCFSDTPASRTLRVASFTGIDNMTIEACLAFCTSPVAYNFAGVEFSRECYCDNVIESSGTQIDESTCNMPCTGNVGEICGGAGAINIFKNTAVAAPPLPPPSPKPKQTVGSFQYAGCYLDGVNGALRSLPIQINLSNVTAESCTNACQSRNFPVAGLEFGQECWCATYMNLATEAPDSDCNFPCAEDGTEICGAGNRLSVYVDTSAAPIASNQCIPTSQFSPVDFQFNLEMIPLSGNSTPTILGVGPDTAIQRGIFELTARNLTFSASPFNTSAEAHVFTLSGTNLFPESFNSQLGGSEGQQPTPGSSQLFVSDSTVNPLGKFCSAVNPFSPSSYIGPPILLVQINGQTGFKWGACEPDPLTPIFSPTIDGVQCVEVLLVMNPPTIDP